MRRASAEAPKAAAGSSPAERLAASAFFKGLSPDACRRLAQLCRHRSLAKNDILFLEQTRGESVFLLVRGLVRLHKAAADGAEVVIRTVKPGEVFAEVVLFEQDRYPVTATAVTASEVLSLGRCEIRRLLAHQAFRDDVIASLLRRLRYLAGRVREAASSDVETRFFSFLREHHGGALEMAQDMSKRDLAAAIGTTPETLSRLIRRLSSEGRLLWRGRSIRLPLGYPRDGE